MSVKDAREPEGLRCIPHPGQRALAVGLLHPRLLFLEKKAGEGQAVNETCSLAPPAQKPLLVLQTGAEGTWVQQTPLLVKIRLWVCFCAS